MMETYKEDLRIVRTKKLLKDALFRLLQEKPIEDITVNEICDRAMIHRTTFYKHYEDKYHLLASLMQELQLSLLSAEELSVLSDRKRELYMLLADRIFSYLAENRTAYLSILEHNKSDVVLRMLYEISVKAVKGYVGNAEQAYCGEVPAAAVARFYAGGLASLAIWYLQNGQNIALGDMKRYVSALVSGMPDVRD